MVGIGLQDAPLVCLLTVHVCVPFPVPHVFVGAMHDPVHETSL